MTDSFLRLSAVIARTGLSRSTLYEQMAKGRFPRPVQLGPRAVGWLSGEVDTWTRARIGEGRKAWIPPESDMTESHEAHVA
jgi:prophage regulatory protein